jgi:GntR family transcriptional regulator
MPATPTPTLTPSLSLAEAAAPSAAARRRADRAHTIAEILRRQVVGGAFPDGVLPDEQTLADEFAASRNAVRQALDALRAEGLVERVPGTGTLVTAEKYAHGLNRLTGLAETLHEHGPVTNEVRAAGRVPAPAAVASGLRLPPGADVVYIERLRRVGGLPLSLDLTYLAPDIGAPLLGEDLVNNDLFALIERSTGRRLGVAELTVEAVSADRHTAAVLQAPPGAALLAVERLSHLDGGRPVDLEFIRFRGDRLTMTARLNRV